MQPEERYKQKDISSLSRPKNKIIIFKYLFIFVTMNDLPTFALLGSKKKGQTKSA
jgi:hypothetical protein